MDPREAANTYAQYRAGADNLKRRADACLQYLNTLPADQRKAAFQESDVIYHRLMQPISDTADRLIG